MSQTILYGSHETTISDAAAEGDRLWVSLGDLECATGWKLEPRGLCQAEVCVPVSSERRREWLDGDRMRFDVSAFAAHLGQPVVRDESRGIWSFGPAAGAGGTSTAAGPVMAPDFELPDLDGKLHSLSAYRGRKVYLFCWASW